jgi:putative SOS response-associated peptidase YedK
MCGRYAASSSPDDLAIEFEAVRAEGQKALPADYNVAPTKDVYVVRHKKERDWCRRGPRTCRSATGC